MLRRPLPLLLAFVLASCAAPRREAPRDGAAAHDAAASAAPAVETAASPDSRAGATASPDPGAGAATGRGSGSGAGAATGVAPGAADAGKTARKVEEIHVTGSRVRGDAPAAGAGAAPASPGRELEDAAPPPVSREVTLHAPRAAAPAVSAPAMKAGRHDDNKEYNRFLSFLAENASLVVFPVDVSERLVLRALDRDGKSLAGCAVSFERLDGHVLASAVTYADGRTQFFPAADAAPTDRDFRATARCAGETRHAQLPRLGRREVEVRFSGPRALPRAVPVDIAIVIDTTGSMQGQIDRLKKTLRAIHFQLTALPTRPDIRFGLVAFRDHGDDYVTRVTPFSSDVASFQHVLDRLEADGGGDTPEDMQGALDAALHRLAWRSDAVRLGFVISDAAPHTDYPEETFDYRAAMRESLSRGIKWVMVGAGGLGLDGEVVYRQIAQHTMAEYVFVTDAPPGDAEGGAGEASHHVGANYRTENLDQAIVRIVRRELSYLGDAPRDFDDTIVAEEGGSRDDVLGPAVDEAVRQLADYSALKLAPRTPVAVVPVASDASHAELAGYLSDRLTLAASRNPSFRVVERDLRALAQEQKLQLSDLFDVAETVPIGKLVGAEALVVTRLTLVGGQAALFAKLVRVETGEVLSVARVEMAKAEP